MDRLWVRHLAIWLVYLVFYLWSAISSFWQLEAEHSAPLLGQKLAALPFIVVAVYVNLKLLIPQFLFKKRYITYFSCSFLFWLYGSWTHVLVTRMAAAINGVIQSMVPFLFGAEETDGPVVVAIRSLSPSDFLTDLFMTLLVSTILGVMIDRYQREKRAETLAKEQLATELQFLRSQIQPHFFMNTLNNIYGMILPLSSQVAGLVIDLSELMRYILYETSEERVLLSREVGMLKNYIALEKARLGQKVEVNFEISSSLDGYMLPPMILIVFVENSFKHGAYQAINNGWLEVFLSVEEGWLTFKVENSSETVTEEEDGQPGIGLKNVRKRLDLLYPDRYTLETFRSEEAFLAVLKIQLK